MSDKLNRQARFNVLSPWQDFGNVTLEDAAVALVERANLVADKVSVQIRDAAEPETIWTVTVEAYRAFKVSGLRGGDC